MDQVFPRLYIGDYQDAEQASLDECPCILTLCERAPTLRDAGFAHIHAPIPDETYLKPHVWHELVHVLTRAVRDEPAVLVHCRLGVSRSPTLLAAYLTCCGWTLESALALLVSVRPQVRPHEETWRSICDWNTREPCVRNAGGSMREEGMAETVRYFYYRNEDNYPLITVAMVTGDNGSIGYGWAIVGAADHFFKDDYMERDRLSGEWRPGRGGRTIARERARCAMGNPKRGVQIADGIWRYKRTIARVDALTAITRSAADGLLDLVWQDTWEGLPKSLHPGSREERLPHAAS